MTLFGNSGSSFGSSNSNNTKEHTVQEVPADTVSRLQFTGANSQNGQFLAATSWANDVRIWQVATQNSGGSSFGNNGNFQMATQAKAMKNHEGPALDCCWTGDNSKLFSVGADKKGMLWDLGADSFQQVATHDQPITCCGYAKGNNYECMVTGSLDKTIKMWDMRQATPAKTFNCPERVYALDLLMPIMVAVTADKKLLGYRMDNDPSEWKVFESQLKQQLRCVSIFKNKAGTEPSGFAVGSIEGRVAIHNFQPDKPVDNFTFKCHRGPSNTNSRDAQEIYPVNDIAFHPNHTGLLATTGSDGKYTFWDKDNRTKIHGAQNMNTNNDPKKSISCCSIDHEGKIFAYSVGYDWHRGHESNDPNTKPQIVLRNVVDEFKPKSK
ncbi:unnamed protein product [Oikopleura dioica]|uniref:Rae1 protein homolog n=2 Tax=Oikopleura dioica TaxID=34765 RepID=E4YQL7_OIKDI|nr:unnamed protein product [Oikopleura dioica]